MLYGWIMSCDAYWGYSDWQIKNDAIWDLQEFYENDNIAESEILVDSRNSGDRV